MSNRWAFLRLTVIVLAVLRFHPAPAQQAKDLGITFSGKVIDAASGQQIPKFRMVAAPFQTNSTHTSWQSHLVKHFDAGELSWHWPRNYDLTVIRIDAEGYAPYVSKPIAKDAGEVDLDVKLLRDGGINGKVLTPNAHWADGAQVAICTWSCEVCVEKGELRYAAGHGLKLGTLTTSGANGAFHLPPEIDPWVVVVAHDSGYAEVTAAEFATSKTIDLKPWARLEVTYAPGGKGVPDQMFSVGAGRGDVDVVLHYNDSAVTDADGKFVLERVAPVTLYAQPFFKTGEGSVSLLWFSGLISPEAGKTTRLTLPRAGQTLKGRVALPADSKLKLADFEVDIRIFLRPPSISGFQDRVQSSYAAYSEFMSKEAGKSFTRERVSVDENGEFKIADLLETQYALQIHAVEKQGASKNLDRHLVEGWHTQRVTVAARTQRDELLDLGELSLTLHEQVSDKQKP
jgi:hypothetical protein